jgi:hypothetical protein
MYGELLVGRQAKSLNEQKRDEAEVVVVVVTVGDDEARILLKRGHLAGKRRFQFRDTNLCLA